MLLATVSHLSSLHPSCSDYTGLYEVYAQVVDYCPHQLVLQTTELRRLGQYQDGNDSQQTLKLLTVNLAEELKIPSPQNTIVQIKGYWTDQAQMSAFEVVPVKDPAMFEETVFCQGLLDTSHHLFSAYTQPKPVKRKLWRNS
ncbi:hypothetical protein TRICI_002768 [Trichomonascus ciferrii]|uniref:Uncharacterized protein n=1 Tax=Trichomonascus ciferrii TaxID=44093 RepID=A0A642V5S8_9ASCO|nr:hypothetical protein TRICI_002768 [Trichomonascus ciferrii]